jgi:hypothetical protein
MNKMYLAIVTSVVLLTSFLTMNVAQPVKADPNCDKAGVGETKSGNANGNSKCFFDNSLGDGKNPEPNRDCSNSRGDFHKNGLKDNDGDNHFTCINRGK